jgi:hypothetical protein
MMKRTASALAVLLLSSAAIPAFAGTATGTLTVNIAAATSGQTIANNTIAVSLDPSQTAAVTNYPLQFGRPFLEGAVPNGQQAEIVYTPAGGSVTALPTQMDVKNRYPDGSVEYAVMAVVLPTIPAGATPSTIAFQTTAAGSNTPLTAVQMEAASFNFDANTALSGSTGVNAATPAVLTGGQTNQTCPTGTATDCWTTSDAPGPFSLTVTNGGFDITIDGVLTHVTEINFTNLTLSWGKFDRDIAAALPACVTQVLLLNHHRRVTELGQLVSGGQARRTCSDDHKIPGAHDRLRPEVMRRNSAPTLYGLAALNLTRGRLISSKNRAFIVSYCITEDLRLDSGRITMDCKNFRHPEDRMAANCQHRP